MQYNKQESPAQIDLKDKLFTVGEAASFLRVRVGTVYQYVFRKILRHYKLNNRRLYFKLEDLQNFVINEQNLVQSNKEIEDRAGAQMMQEHFNDRH